MSTEQLTKQIHFYDQMRREILAVLNDHLLEKMPIGTTNRKIKASIRKRKIGERNRQEAENHTIASGASFMMVHNILVRKETDKVRSDISDYYEKLIDEMKNPKKRRFAPKSTKTVKRKKTAKK